MLISEIFESVLDEGATDILYHYTRLWPANEILQNNQFELANIVGSDSEKKQAPKGYNYFLSTTTSRSGSYHDFVGADAVMFVLDGQRISQRYPVRPIDYWEGTQGGYRHSESEDRVWSREPVIPADFITAIHVLKKDAWSDRANVAARQLFITAKKRGIPVYLYTDASAWRLQDKRKTIPIKDIIPALKTDEPLPNSSYRRFSRDYLLPWLELVMKPVGQELSSEAKKYKDSIQRYYAPWRDGIHGKDMILNLSNDMSNARKPGNADRETLIKLTSAMRKLKLGSVKDMLDYLADKYKETN